MQREIPSLDGLRAISIFFVILSHSFSPVPDHGFLFNLLLKHAGMGVRIFFIISGYLITTLCLREREKHGSLSLSLFYARRALRILPAFYLYTLAMLAVGLVGRLPIDNSNWAYVFTWTVNFNPMPSWFVAHLWSLSVEEQFYLTWPLALKFLRLRAWIAIAVVAIFAGLLTRAFHLLDPERLPYAFPFVAAPLALGCLVALREPQFRALVGGWKLAFVAPALAATLVFETATEMQGGAFRPVAELAVDAILTLAVAWCVFVPPRFLNSRPMVEVGRLSYSLYLWQELFLWRTAQTTAIMLPAWCGVILFGSASYFLVERPFFSWRRRLSRG